MFWSQNLGGVLNIALSLRGGTCPFKNFQGGGQGFAAFHLGVFDTFPKLSQTPQIIILLYIFSLHIKFQLTKLSGSNVSGWVVGLMCGLIVIIRPLTGQLVLSLAKFSISDRFCVNYKFLRLPRTLKFNWVSKNRKLENQPYIKPLPINFTSLQEVKYLQYKFIF